MVARIARWLALSAVCLAALPALADAQLTWQRVADPGPGSTFDYDSDRGPTRVNFAVADGVPYVAVLSRPTRSQWELRAYRAVRRNSEWRQIDGLLNGDPSNPVSLLGMAAYSGRPYIALATGSGLEILRLRRNGKGFERVERGLGSPQVADADLVVRDGRLYVSYTDLSGTLRSARLNRAGNRWEDVAPVTPSDGVLVGGTLYTYTLVGPAPEAANIFTLYATRRGVTEEAPNPTVTGNDVTDVHLQNADGTLWMIWIEGGGGAMSPPRIVHVARLVRQ
jgi:hypothetical protein